MSSRVVRYAVATLIGFLLQACGGGGGSAPAGPPVSTLSFPLQSAANAFVANGVTKTFTISLTAPNAAGTPVTCSGTGTDGRSPAAEATTFEGRPALASSDTTIVAIVASPGCNAANTSSILASYYDSNFVALGHEIPGTEYGVYLTAPSLPTSVKVGDAGSYGTETLFTDRTKATRLGTRAQTFVIEPDTATSAIVNLISTDLNVAGAVIATEQDRSRIMTVGALVPTSSEVQASNGVHATVSFGP